MGCKPKQHKQIEYHVCKYSVIQFGAGKIAVTDALLNSINKNDYCAIFGRKYYSHNFIVYFFYIIHYENLSISLKFLIIIKLNSMKINRKTQFSSEIFFCFFFW